MELEFFCKPGTELEWFAYWKDFCHQWLLGLGMKDENLRLRDHDQEELSHYPTPPPTSSSCSPSAGASCGAWPPAPTTT